VLLPIAYMHGFLAPNCSPCYVYEVQVFFTQFINTMSEGDRRGKRSFQFCLDKLMVPCLGLLLLDSNTCSLAVASCTSKVTSCTSFKLSEHLFRNVKLYSGKMFFEMKNLHSEIGAKSK